MTSRRRVEVALESVSQRKLKQGWTAGDWFCDRQDRLLSRLDPLSPIEQTPRMVMIRVWAMSDLLGLRLKESASTKRVYIRH